MAGNKETLAEISKELKKGQRNSDIKFVISLALVAFAFAANITAPAWIHWLFVGIGFAVIPLYFLIFYIRQRLSKADS